MRVIQFVLNLILTRSCTQHFIVDVLLQRIADRDVRLDAVFFFSLQSSIQRIVSASQRSSSIDVVCRSVGHVRTIRIQPCTRLRVVQLRLDIVLTRGSTQHLVIDVLLQRICSRVQLTERSQVVVSRCICSSHRATERSRTSNIQVTTNIRVRLHRSVTSNVQRAVQRSSTINIQRIVQGRSTVNINSIVEISSTINRHRSVEVSVLRSREAVNRGCTVNIEITCH